MGVHNLWQLLLPVGRRVNVESLERKTLAIDVSIWLTQFIKAMRDDEGKVVKNAHIIGTFRRIVKLLFYRIRPIFVFDGGTPEIKRRTVMSRKRRREDQETSVRKTAQRLLLAQLKKQHILSGSTVLTGASGKNKKQKADLEPVGSLGAEAGFAAGFIPGAPEKARDPPDAEVAGREEFVAGDGSQDARKGAEKVYGHGINGDGGSIRQRSAAAAFAQALPAAASDEEEEVEWEEEEDSGTDDVGDILLEDDNVDVMVLASLPPELQKDVVESAKRRQRLLSRQAFMPVAGNPALYSQAQISNFLKSSRLNQKVSSLREVLGDDGNRDEGGIGAGGKDQPESSAGSGTCMVEPDGDASGLKRAEFQDGCKDTTEAVWSRPGHAPQSSGLAGVGEGGWSRGGLREDDGRDGGGEKAVDLVQGGGFLPEDEHIDGRGDEGRGGGIGSMGGGGFLPESEGEEGVEDGATEGGVQGGPRVMGGDEECGLVVMKEAGAPLPRDDSSSGRMDASREGVGAGANTAEQWLEEEEREMALAVRMSLEEAASRGGREGRGASAVEAVDDDGQASVPGVEEEKEGGMRPLPTLGSLTTAKGPKEADDRETGGLVLSLPDAPASVDDAASLGDFLAALAPDRPPAPARPSGPGPGNLTPVFLPAKGQQSRAPPSASPGKTAPPVSARGGGLRDPRTAGANPASSPSSSLSKSVLPTEEAFQNAVATASRLTTWAGVAVRRAIQQHVQMAAPGVDPPASLPPTRGGQMYGREKAEGQVEEEASWDETLPFLQRGRDEGSDHDEDKEGEEDDIEWEGGDDKEDLSAEEERDESLGEEGMTVDIDGDVRVGTTFPGMVAPTEAAEAPTGVAWSRPTGGGSGVSAEAGRGSLLTLLEPANADSGGRRDLEEASVTVRKSEEPKPVAEWGGLGTGQDVMGLGNAGRVCDQTEARAHAEDAKEQEEEEGKVESLAIASEVSHAGMSLTGSDDVLGQGTEEYEDMSRDLDDEAALRSRMRKELRDAETVSQEMREDIMHLLQLFGVPYLVAPMEAEAQCAVLETLGLVDGVVSDDSDSFLFGARAVYKNIFDERKYVEAYRAEDLERELGLKRVDLVSLALLLGSDYTEGVKGVGIVNAMEVVRAFAPREEGEGETEVRGGKPEEGLQHFKAWLDGFDPLGDLSLRADRKLVDDREEDEAVDKAGEEGGSTRRRAAWVTQKVEAFHSKHKSARTRWVVTERFPDPAIYRAYLQPQVNASTDSFTWGVPDLDGLRVHLAQKLGWPVSETDSHLLPMLRRMQETVWQSRLDSYFLGYQDNVKFAKIKSKRLQRAVADLKPGGSIALEKEENTESGQEGAETMEIENARKIRKGSRKGGNARLCEGTNADVNRKEAQRTKALSPSKKMRRVQKRKKSLGQCSSSSGGSSSDEGEEREEGSVKGNGRGIAEADTRVPARLRGRRGGRGRKVVILDDEEASGSEHMAEE